MKCWLCSGPLLAPSYIQGCVRHISCEAKLQRCSIKNYKPAESKDINKGAIKSCTHISHNTTDICKVNRVYIIPTGKVKGLTHLSKTSCEMSHTNFCYTVQKNVSDNVDPESAVILTTLSKHWQESV